MIGREYNINGKTYFVPFTWAEISLEKALELLSSNGDWLFELSGIPIEVAAIMPESEQEFIASAMDNLLQTVPTKPKELPNIGAAKFERYAFAMDSIKKPTRFVQVWYQIEDKGADVLLPKYWALVEAWNKWDEMWPSRPLDSKLIKAGINNLGERFGIYAWIAEMAQGDILKENSILDLETMHVFKHRQYFAEKAIFTEKLMAK